MTMSVICAAMTLDGVMNGSIAGGVQGQISRTNADLSVDTFGGGVAKVSPNATIATIGATGSITASVTPVPGALGYAWYWGAPGAEVLGQLTTINSVVITANALGTQLASSLGPNDNSSNALAFDGLIYQALIPGSNSYVSRMASGSAGIGSH